MKLFSNKSIFLVLIISMLGLVGWFGYNTYNSYILYTKSKTNTEGSLLVEQVNEFIEQLTQEELNSAIYFGTSGQQKFQELKTSRINVDAKFASLKSALNTKKFSKYLKELDGIDGDLKYARAKIDSLNGTYKEVLDSVYYQKIFNVLYSLAKDISSSDSSEIVKNYLSTYLNYISVDKSISMEKALILDKLLSKSKFNNTELEFWNTLILNENLPNIDNLKDTKLKATLRKLVSQDHYNELVNKARLDVLYNARHGVYDLKPKVWSEKLNTLEEYMTESLSLIESSLKSHFEHKLLASQDEFKQNAIKTGAVFFVLLILMLIYRNISRSTQLFESTLKDIERVLNAEQQEELKYLVERKDTNGIYAFLTRTIDESSKAKDLFLANMSHEIRTPLNGIVGFTQLLKSTELNAEQEEFISVIESSSENLLMIVNDILDLSKIKANKIEIENIEFSTIDKFESSIESYAARAVEKNIDLRVFINPTLPRKIVGDPTKISQVIVNLISNAIKFTDNGGVISVDIDKVAETDNDVSIKFSVADTGIGISKEQKDKIFEAFSQADISTSRKYGGTGLGLAISSKLVSFMGGELDIHSVEGEGSTFFFTLTLKKAEVQPKDHIIKMENKVRVALVVPEEDMVASVDRNYKAYVEYTGAKFEVVPYAHILKMHTLPDIVFIDHRYCDKEEDIQKCLSLDTKKVVFIASDHKKDIEKFESDIDSIVYKPSNLSRTTKALEVLFEPEKKEDVKVEQQTQQMSFDNVKALVAEDNAINQKLIKNILNALGIDVVFANNGQEAFEHRQNSEFDIIFMDIQMPVMGGIDATKHIIEYEEKNRKHHIPIIALTANALKGDKEKYLKAGMDGYLSKPIELDALKTVLMQYFSKSLKTDYIEDKNDSDDLNNNVEEDNSSNEILHLNDESSIEDVVETKEDTLTKDESDQMIQSLNEEVETDEKTVEDNIELSKEKSADILLFKSTKLSSNLYASLLKNLGYTLEVINSSDEFMDKVENQYYDFVLFDVDSFENIYCLIVDIIKDRGAKAFVFESKKISEVCCDVLSSKPEAQELKEKLQ